MPIIRLIVFYKAAVHHSYSANGEDLLITSMIGGRAEVWYLDVGAGDPRIHSNTYALYRRGGDGVAVDANMGLLTKFKEMRPRDRTIWGVITRTASSQTSVTYWTLDPWELSTADANAMQKALKNGARIVSENQFPSVDIDAILGSTFPTDGRTTLLNVDIEGSSFEVLNSINFRRFPFDYVLVERDSPKEAFGAADNEDLPPRYRKVRSLGPTDVYSRVGYGPGPEADA
jgi:hypothetical protein